VSSASFYEINDELHCTLVSEYKTTLTLFYTFIIYKLFDDKILVFYIQRGILEAIDLVIMIVLCKNTRLCMKTYIGSLCRRIIALSDSDMY